MSNMSNVCFPPQIGNYLLGQALGSGVSGAFHTSPSPIASSPICWAVGSTFHATQIHTGQVVALKVQPLDVSYPSNTHERMIYPMLQGGAGIPTLWASGIWKSWDYLAMDLLGSSLDRLYRKSGKNMMDLRSACSFAVQLVCPLPFTSGLCPII
jgi:casein kinase 1